MQPNLNMIAPADLPSDSRKRVRGEDIPPTPEMRAKVSKLSTEERSPAQRWPDASDVRELSPDGMKDATDATGPQHHWKIQPALPSCLKATTCNTPDDRATGQVDNRWQKPPDDEVIFETLWQAEDAAIENIPNPEQPVSIHEVNAQWTRMTKMHRSSTSVPRISWSKKLHVTHVYFEISKVDTEFEQYHERLKIKSNKLQIEVEELRGQVLAGLKKIVGLKREEIRQSQR